MFCTSFRKIFFQCHFTAYAKMKALHKHFFSLNESVEKLLGKRHQLLLNLRSAQVLLRGFQLEFF